MGTVHAIPGVRAIAGAVQGYGYVLGQPLAEQPKDEWPTLFEAHHTRVAGTYTLALFPLQLSRQADLVRALERDIRLGSFVRHPRVVQTFDFNDSGEAPAFVVLEQLQGRSLAAVMRQDGMMSLTKVIDVMGQIADALESAGRLKVFHGGLSPRLIWLADDDPGGGGTNNTSTTIIGFGWGRLAGAALGQRAPRPPAACYLAPEQRSSAVPPTAAADQFSLGTIAYEMLTGCLPFSDDGKDLVNARASRRQQPPSFGDVVVGLPRALDQPFRRALCDSPDGRFPQVRDFVDALRAIAAVPLDAQVNKRIGLAAPAIRLADPTRPITRLLRSVAKVPRYAQILFALAVIAVVAATTSQMYRAYKPAPPSPVAVPSIVPVRLPTTTPSTERAQVGEGTAAARSGVGPSPGTQAVLVGEEEHHRRRLRLHPKKANPRARFPQRNSNLTPSVH